MTTPLRVVTTGLAVTYPFGGVFWDYVQYPLGLHRLGHEVLYLEDTGKWCYDPAARTFVETPGPNAAAFARNLAAAAPELADRWCYRYPSGETAGWGWDEVTRFCRRADLFLDISGACLMRDEHRAAARVAFIDSDPLYTQAALVGGGTDPDAAWRRTWFTHYHDVFFTFGENVGRPDCAIPTGPLDWVPTRQPVVLDRFTRAAVPACDRRPVFTTVASWEPTEKGPVVNGVTYAGKSREFERFLDLPGRSPLPIEVALSGPAPTDRLRARGWQLRDGYEVSHDAVAYRDYLAASAGEWSVAKNAYVASRSGWFSCRTACYLALGVPAVVQDTGFSRVITTGAGLFAFDDLDGAVAGLERVARDPDRQAAAARALAVECFDSDDVLADLIERALA